MLEKLCPHSDTIIEEMQLVLSSKQGYIFQKIFPPRGGGNDDRGKKMKGEEKKGKKGKGEEKRGKRERGRKKGGKKGKKKRERGKKKGGR